MDKIGACNIRYDFLKVRGDVFRLLCRNVCRKICAHVEGRLSGGARVRRPGSEDPHQCERKFDELEELNQNTINNNKKGSQLMMIRTKEIQLRMI